MLFYGTKRLLQVVVNTRGYSVYCEYITNTWITVLTH